MVVRRNRDDRPVIAFYRDSFGGWRGTDQYLHRLIETFDYDRFRLRILLLSPPACDPMGLTSGAHPLEVAVLPSSGAGDVAPEPSGSAPCRPSLQSWWVRTAPQGMRFAMGFARDVRRLSKWLRPLRADLIHIFDGERDPAPVAARLARYPCIVTSYACLPDADPDAGRWHKRQAERLSFRCADRVIVKTGAAGRIWARQLDAPIERFAVIPNGIDLARFENPADGANIRNELGIPEEALVVGLSASLSAYKGHVHLLKAAVEVRRRVPNVLFVFAGDGPLRNELEAESSALGLDGAVCFLGVRHDIPALTRCYDVAVLPSLSETFGWAAAEAMACRRPVVASALPTIAEVVEDGVSGILVPPARATELADALTRLLRDPALRRRMGEAGYRRVRDKFTVERMRDLTLELYEGLLARRRMAAWHN